LAVRGRRRARPRDGQVGGRLDQIAPLGLGVTRGWWGRRQGRSGAAALWPIIHLGQAPFRSPPKAPSVLTAPPAAEKAAGSRSPKNVSSFDAVRSRACLSRAGAESSRSAVRPTWPGSALPYRKSTPLRSRTLPGLRPAWQSASTC